MQSLEESMRLALHRSSEASRQDTASPGGTFNGAPIYLQSITPEKPLLSAVHCVGDNYRPGTAWKQRSCRFSNLCFNTTDEEFVIFESDDERGTWEAYFRHRDYFRFSTTMRLRRPVVNGSVATMEDGVPSVSLGGINQKWGDSGERLRWFPKIVSPEEQRSSPISHYYRLPDSVVLIPFHSLNGANPGHLVWDDFLPMYTLLRMFRLQHKTLMPLRYVLNDGKGQKGLWASCDTREENKRACQRMIEKFLPLVTGGDYPYRFTTNRGAEFRPNNGATTSTATAANAKNAELVCAKTAVAGMGSLTDHGISKGHGWLEEDYELTHNQGRGPMILEFRNFIMDNLLGPLGGEDATTTAVVGLHRRPHRIIFSEQSSDIPNRNVNFDRQIQMVRQAFEPDGKAVVERYVFKRLNVREQALAVRNASVYVSLCGGGAVTATLMPPGSAVILFYDERGGVRANRPTGKPARLDWDLFNAMSHLRVHWMPRDSRNAPLDEMALVVLLQHEFEIMESRVFALD